MSIASSHQPYVSRHRPDAAPCRLITTTACRRSAVAGVFALIACGLATAAEADEEALAPVVEVVAEAAAPAAAVEVVAEAPVAAFDLVFPAPAVAPAADEDAQLAPFLAQFRPLLVTELSFANRVCKLTDEQRQAAIAAGKASLDKFVREHAKNQGQVQAGLVWFGGRQPQLQADPRRTIVKEVADAVKKLLDPKQLSIYEAELTKRSDFQRQAAINNLVAKIDERLTLSDKQRKELTKSLEAKWDDAWAPQLESFMHMGDYLPQIPEEHVTPHLSPEQLTLWNGVQKVNFGPVFGGQMHWFGGVNVQIEDINLDADN